MSGPPFLEDGYFTIGSTQSPITTSLANTLLRDCDPTLFFMLKYYTGIFQLHILPRWNACIAAAGLMGLDGYVPNEVLPYDPFRMGLAPQNSWRFPLLAVYPLRSQYAFITTMQHHIGREFELIFCLPPLNSEQYEYLHPFLQFSEKLLLNRTMQGFDTNFNSGELVWKEAVLEKIGINSSSIGDLGIGNIKFPTMRMSITVWEKVMFDDRNFELADGYSELIHTLAPTDGYGPLLTIFDGYAGF